ncbi:MAG TPA: PhzF family phenazine biosynthesis protein [Gemmatimonadales bacterium]|nr:PhzF family phenazine biosynthesis protein [Gemmatimonadales bacterium]
MKLPIVQVDAFAERAFTGNPAAVCLLASSLPDASLLAIAGEMNLSETAFLLARTDGSYDLRWFTPAVEVDLCGHATLASAHVLWQDGHLAPDADARFHTRSGELGARRIDGRIVLDFPAQPAHAAPPPAGLLEALGVSQPRFVGRNTTDWMVEVENSATVRGLAPDFSRLGTVEARGVMVTAPGDDGGIDFVSRFFAPASGIDEDPVTGSAHCCMGPFWAERLGRTSLVARQLSARGGTVHVEVAGARVRLGGTAVTVMRGELEF